MYTDPRGSLRGSTGIGGTGFGNQCPKPLQGSQSRKGVPQVEV